MTDKAASPFPAETLGAEPIYSLQELSNACNVEAAWVAELVEHGVIEAHGTSVSQWRFSSISVVRLAKAKRFDRDLGVNAAGIALVLDLLSEIDSLKARLNVLSGQHSSLAEHSESGEQP
jgi:chaperone modulatory protein CbpM